MSKRALRRTGAGGGPRHSHDCQEIPCEHIASGLGDGLPPPF